MGNLSAEVIIRELKVESAQFRYTFARILSYHSKAKNIINSFTTEERKELESILQNFTKKLDGMYKYIHKDM